MQLRPGNAGANTAADHIDVLDAAIAQVPRVHRKRLLVRVCGTGCCTSPPGSPAAEDADGSGSPRPGPGSRTSSPSSPASPPSRGQPDRPCPPTTRSPSETRTAAPRGLSPCPSTTSQAQPAPNTLTAAASRPHERRRLMTSELAAGGMASIASRIQSKTSGYRRVSRTNSCPHAALYTSTRSLSACQRPRSLWWPSGGELVRVGPLLGRPEEGRDQHGLAGAALPEDGSVLLTDSGVLGHAAKGISRTASSP